MDETALEYIHLFVSQLFHPIKDQARGLSQYTYTYICAPYTVYINLHIYTCTYTSTHILDYSIHCEKSGTTLFGSSMKHLAFQIKSFVFNYSSFG